MSSLRSVSGRWGAVVVGVAVGCLGLSLAPAAGAAEISPTVASVSERLGVIGAPPVAKINEPYSYQFTATGPEGTQLMPAGKLPPGLSFNYETGVLSGTPTAPRPETFTFGITAYFHSGEDDEWPETATRSFQLPYEATRNYTEIGNSTTQSVYTLNPLRTINSQDLWCPLAQPYLIDQHLAAARILPHGVTVREGGEVRLGVSGAAHFRDGFQAGISGLSISNPTWSQQTITITLHCTNNQDEARRG